MLFFTKLILMSVVLGAVGCFLRARRRLFEFITFVFAAEAMTLALRLMQHLVKPRRVARHGAAKSRVIELGALHTQTGFNVSQALAMLDKRVEVIPALDNEFGSFVRDSVAGFDSHSGPYRHYAIFTNLKGILGKMIPKVEPPEHPKE